MCYCTPNIRTPYCTNCAPMLYARVKKLEETQAALVVASLKMLNYMARNIPCKGLTTDNEEDKARLEITFSSAPIIQAAQENL